MKRLSRTIMTAMLVALLAFSLVGCKSTAKVEPIPPAPVEPAPEPVTPVEPAPELVEVPEPEPMPEPAPPAPAPVAEEPKELVLPYGVQEIVKNDDGAKVFDLIIVHTNDLNGNIYSENGGLGLARLSTALKAGRALTDNWLLLNSGNVGEVPAEAAMLAAEVVDELGYDAYTPQAVQLATGIAGTKKALPLSANALDANGYLVAQPYQVYTYNGFKVGVVGLVAPKPIQGVSFTSDLILDNAQYAVDMAQDYVDYIVVLSDLGSKGDLTSEMVAQNIDGIDLIVDGNGSAMAKTVNGTLIVRADEMLKSVGGVQVSVANGKVKSVVPMILPAADVLDPAKSAIAKAYEPFARAMGYTLQVSVPEDPAIVSMIGATPKPMVKAEVPAKVEAPAPAPEVKEEAPAPAPAPVAEEPKELVLPYGVQEIVKNDDGAKVFDLIIVHTNDLNGNIYSENGGLGLARLSTALKAGRALTDNWLLLNSGNVGEVPAEAAMLAAEVVDELGYDAYTPQAVQLATGIAGTKKALPLSANALDANGYLVAQPYQVYTYNGFKVGVVGLVAPKAIQGVSFTSDLILDNAQYAVDMAQDYVDYIVVLSDLGSKGDLTSEMVAQNIDGIDLIVDGNGSAMAKTVNGTLIVRADEMLKSVGGVQVSVANGKVKSVVPMILPAADVLDPAKSAIAKAYEPFARAMGYTLQVSVPEDPAIVSMIGATPKPMVKAEVPAKVEAPAPAPEVKEEAPAPAPAPVAEEPKELVLPYGVQEIVKNDDGAKVFDLIIVHTNDLNGNIYSENGGLGLARLSTALKAGRALTDNWLLLNSGNVGEVPAEAAMLAAEVVDELGYDAYTPQAVQLATGIAGTKKALPLSANALDANGYLVAQPYQVYTYNGFKVGVVGLVAPKPIQGVSFTSDLILDNAQYAVDMAQDYVDYIVVLSDLGSKGDLTSEMVAQNIDGIDLIVDGNGSAMAKTVNGTLIVRADEMLKSVGGVQVSVANGKVKSVVPMILPAADVLDPAKSAIAKAYEPFARAMGYTLQVSVPEDPAIASMIGATPKPMVKAEVPAKVEAPAPAPAPAPVAVEPEPVEYPLGVFEIVKNADGANEFDLFVVHTNDVHGRVVSSEDNIGYSKLATMLKVGRGITDNILVLDAGDVTHGTNVVNMFEGETVGVLLDMLGYDAVVPGNHDFNYGVDRLLEAAEIAENYTDIKVLSANVLDENGYMLFQPYQVYNFNDFTIGVVGLTTPDTATKTHPKNVEGVYFANEEIFEIGQQAIDMAKQYVDYIVVLGHIGMDPDGASGLTTDKIVSNIKGIDLFVDGHSHTLLKQGMKIGDTMIVSAGEYMENLGLVQIHVKNDEVTAVYPMMISAADVWNAKDSDLAKMYGIAEVPNDAEVDEYLGYMTAKLDAKLNTVIATVPEMLDGERANVRTKPTNLSRLITRAMTAESGADFTITNGGGIRASIDAGEVTIGEVINVLPFTNIVTVVEVTGADVYAALEHGYSKLPETNGAFSQTDLQVVYNRYGKPGSRILRVLLNGKAIDKNATYKVATNDFMAAGGDGYTMFGKVLSEGSLLSDVFIEFLSKNYPAK
nr:5'-nucleotidase C-terminal domain-containing protein [uncultured Sphaerochaeta sp.]